MGKHYAHLDLIERSKIETRVKDGKTYREIAAEIGRAPSTICREVKRHEVEQFRGRDGYKLEYDCEAAQRMSEQASSRKGRHLKIGDDHETANALEGYLSDGYSPYAAVVQAKRDGRLKTEITARTLYSYIYNGVLSVGDEVLVHGPRRKRKKVKPEFKKRGIAHNTIDYPSIEERPKSVLGREEFGHWEADTVVSSRKGRNRGAGKSVLLTMIERKSRFAIAVKLMNRKAESVVAGFDLVERHFGPDVFRKIFKTITFDNGLEFMDVDGIRRSFKSKGEDTALRVRDIYFCHPFCSSERGSNEVMHTFIRRKWPKGTNFASVNSEEIARYMDWVNNYPRKIHGGNSAREVFTEELAKL